MSPPEPPGRIVNLRLERKRRRRAAAETAASVNRAAFGRSQAERAVSERTRRDGEAFLDARRRTPRSEDRGTEGARSCEDRTEDEG